MPTDPPRPETPVCDYAGISARGIPDHEIELRIREACQSARREMRPSGAWLLIEDAAVSALIPVMMRCQQEAIEAARHAIIAAIENEPLHEYSGMKAAIAVIDHLAASSPSPTSARRS